MTKLQYLRWKFFALGMAKHCFPNATEARRKRLYDDLLGYLDWVGDDRWVDGAEYAKFECWDFGVHSHAEEFFQQYYHEDFNGREKGNKYLNQIMCCLRAGIDVAVEPSGGVIGFTIGGVRKIFNGRLPKWVREFWDNHPEIDTLPDDTPVWL